MSFVLSNQRVNDVPAAFKRYNDYLESVRSRFPTSALALATSDWYFGPVDARAPHDSHLEAVTISESPSTDVEAFPVVSIRIRLRSAHGGVIEFFYPEVFRYTLTLDGQLPFHSDWRYDEFHLSDTGHVIHDIEWSHATESGRWVIEASDIEHQFHATGSD